MTTCERTTCCTDNPGAEPTAACFNTAACGCQVVQHDAHPTPDFLAFLAAPLHPHGASCAGSQNRETDEETR